MHLPLLAKYTDIREQRIIALKEAKEAGRAVIGVYCAFTPRELVLASQAIVVSLCGSSEAPIPFAEEELPRNLCPLIKSSYGFARTDTCPFFHFSDFLIGETTCDGKKKMFELLGRIKPLHVMNLPHMPEYQSSLSLWYKELQRLKERLEGFFAIEITDGDLREAIALCNLENRVLKEFFDLNRKKPALIKGNELLEISYPLDFELDSHQNVRIMRTIIEEISSMSHEGYSVCDFSTPRILLTGTPVSLENGKVVSLVEESGGVVVAMENCGGYKTLDLNIDENDQRDPLLLLAEKYLKIPCSVMSPNRGRIEILRKMIVDFQIDAVIDLTWQACHTYNIESNSVAELVKKEFGLPFLQIETDFSGSDKESLRIRIEALLDMI